MASALNKRQQARNEKALQELIRTVPGNSTCADCGAKNPGEYAVRALSDMTWRGLIARQDGQAGV